MEPVLVNKIDDLKPGYKKILEPPTLSKKKFKCNHGPIDLVVPGLAFNRRKYRLGYGGEDFTITTLKHNKPKYSLGVFYDFQKAFFLPRQKNDIRINLIITESETYY